MKALKLGVMWTQAKECWKSPNDERGKKKILPWATGERMALQTPWFGASNTNLISVLKNYERTNRCCIKPPSLWSFATIVLGNQHIFSWWLFSPLISYTLLGTSRPFPWFLPKMLQFLQSLGHETRLSVTIHSHLSSSSSVSLWLVFLTITTLSDFSIHGDNFTNIHDSQQY